MRALSTREKEIIKLINNGVSLFPNLLDKFMPDIGIIASKSQSLQMTGKLDIHSGHSPFSIVECFSVKFLFSIKYSFKESEIPEKLKYIEKLVVEAVNLIRLLEKNGYLFLIQTAIKKNQKFTYGIVPDDDDVIEHVFPDDQIKKLLLEYSIKEIFATPELEIFQKNNFVSKKEASDKKNKFISWIGIGIAIMGTFLNGLFNYTALNKVEQNNNKIELNKISIKIEEVTKELKKFNDTNRLNNKIIDTKTKSTK